MLYAYDDLYHIRICILYQKRFPEDEGSGKNIWALLLNFRPFRLHMLQRLLLPCSSIQPDIVPRISLSFSSWAAFGAFMEQEFIRRRTREENCVWIGCRSWRRHWRLATLLRARGCRYLPFFSRTFCPYGIAVCYQEEGKVSVRPTLIVWNCWCGDEYRISASGLTYGFCLSRSFYGYRTGSNAF